jgi:23S rRNA pseudouridine955/2504/2580 synthase
MRQMREGNSESPVQYSLTLGKWKVPILYENHLCLILNKPAGLAVQGGKGIEISLDSILTQSYKNRPFLVHRLDKDTSGLLLVAKEKEAAAAFSALLRLASLAGEKKAERRGIVKRYIAAAAGIPHLSKGKIRLNLDIRGHIKNSETSYRVLTTSSQACESMFFSLLELELGTGRMHQIRRHLFLIGNPILGDDKYGDFSLNKRLAKTMGLKRLLLHASRLIIPPGELLLKKILPEGLDICVNSPDYFLPFFPGYQFSD